jgi:hypothetical protein
MNIISVEDFFAETMGGRQNTMDMSDYEGFKFNCACGKSHIFSSYEVKVLRELSKMRLFFECPDNHNFATCVKLKGFFRFKGFESLFGTKFENDFDEMDVLKKAFEKKTGLKLDDK